MEPHDQPEISDVESLPCLRPGPPPSVLQRHQLATYFGLAFAISWAIWLGLILGSLHIQTPVGAVLNVVAIAGPSIAALVLATVLGRSELGCRLARLPGRRIHQQTAPPDKEILMTETATNPGADIRPVARTSRVRLLCGPCSSGMPMILGRPMTRW